MGSARQVEVEEEDVVGVEDGLQYLKEHDGEWLVRTLQQRCRELGYHGRTRTSEGNAHEQRADSNSDPQAGVNVISGTGTGTDTCTDTSLAGPYDVTAPTLPLGRVVSEHIAMLRAYPWHETELGPMSSWSVELRRMVNFTLQDRESAVLWWGPMRRCE